MEEEVYIEGASGGLARWDGEAYRPQGCITSLSYEAVMDFIEKVNYCTGGKTRRIPRDINRTVSLEGELIDTTDVGGITAKESGKELREAQEQELVSRTPDLWRLSKGPEGYLYFPAYITNYSDSFPAEGDATFSTSLQIEELPTEVDPHAAPGG